MDLAGLAAQCGVTPNADGAIDTQCLKCGGKALLWVAQTTGKLWARCEDQCGKLDPETLLEALADDFAARQARREPGDEPDILPEPERPPYRGNGGGNGHSNSRQPARIEDDPLQKRLSAEYEFSFLVQQWAEVGGFRTLYPTAEEFNPKLKEHIYWCLTNGKVRGLTDLTAEQADAKAQEIANFYAPLAPDEYADRHAVDAYAAFEAMRTELREYAVDGFLKIGATIAVSGLIGTGKTTFLANLAKSLATGGPFLDREILRAGKVLVVASPKEFDNWCQLFGEWGIKEGVYVVPSTYAHFANPKQAAGWFDAEMQRIGSTYFILDTLFDFFGMPGNSPGDQNRIIMNEQAPLLECVRLRRYAGGVGGHQPKTEAKALDPRDPEEAFAGNTGWMAQHRMRVSLRRKSQGFTAIITGRGGYGDRGILKEELLAHQEGNHFISLGGLFSDHLGKAAVGPVMDALNMAGRWLSRADIEKELGKGKNFVLAGLKEAMKYDPEKGGPQAHSDGKGRGTTYAHIGIPKPKELFEK